MSPYKTILLAIIPEDKNSHNLMAKAAFIAEQNHAELHLSYVEVGIGNISLVDIELELQEEHDDLVKKRMAELSELAASCSYPVKAFHLASGDVDKHLISLAEKIGANLVITGFNKKGIHLFSGVSDSLAKHLECDVLISH